MAIRPSNPRRIMHGAVSLAAIAAMLGAVATSANTREANAAHGNATIPKGGTLIIRMASAPGCLDPPRDGGTPAGWVTQQVADTLVVTDKSGKLRPMLATSWKVSKDGSHVTFYLRKGVKFSNGDTLDANSVKYTFERTQDPATKAAFPGTILKGVKIDVLSKYVVELIAPTPSRILLSGMSLAFEAILDKKAMDAEGSNTCDSLVGSGPFMIQSVAPGHSEFTMVRNPYRNWEPSWLHNKGAPYVSKVIFREIDNDATAASELLSGGVNVALVAGSQIDRFAGNKHFNYFKYQNLGVEVLQFNLGKPPTDSAAVRKALSEAIDRKALVRVAENGQAVPAYSATAPWAYYDKQSPKYAPKFDPTAAQNALSAAGVKGPLTLVSMNDQATTAADELIQAELQQVGVTVNIQPKVFADFDPAARGDNNLILWSYNFFDPYAAYLVFRSDGPFEAYGKFKSSPLDGYLQDTMTHLDKKGITKAFTQVQRYINQNVYVDPLWINLNTIAYAKNIHDYHTNEVGSPFLQDMYITK